MQPNQPPFDIPDPFVIFMPEARASSLPNKRSRCRTAAARGSRLALLRSDMCTLVGSALPPAPMQEIIVGPLRINPESHAVILGAEALQLTPAEFGLLLSLAKAHGRVKTREQLIEEVADREWDVFDRAIDMHISALRKKLGDDPKEPRFIKTVRGYGYQLVTPSR